MLGKILRVQYRRARQEIKKTIINPRILFRFRLPKNKSARNLKAEIDEEKIEAFCGTESIPFESGNRKAVAVKIVDGRGIESLKIIRI